MTYSIKHDRIFDQNIENGSGIVRLKFLRERDILFEKRQILGRSSSDPERPRARRAIPFAKHEVFYQICCGHSAHTRTAGKLEREIILIRFRMTEEWG